MVRLGVEYGFDLGNGWELAPAFDVDFVANTEVWGVGVSISRGF